MRPTDAKFRHYYELRTFTRNKRGRRVCVKTLTIRNEDPHTIAVEFWRLSHLQQPYEIEVRDLGQQRGRLCPLVSYEELVRHAGSKVVTS